jgi:HupE / UreJ protein
MKAWLARLCGILLGLLTLSASRPAHAHKPSDSYVSLDATGAVVSVRWDIALRDLEYALHLDRDGDGAITWGEVRARRADIERYAEDRLTLRADGVTCVFGPSDLSTVVHSDGAYAVLLFQACAAVPSPRRVLDVDYRLLFELDPQHRGLVHVASAGAPRTAIFTATTTSQRLALEGSTGGRGSFVSAVRGGISHIWAGVDHLLFLLALLLPSVLRRENGRWVPVGAFRPALVDVLRIVTAFTFAHSITLSLAALDVVRLPSRLVESAIAASVVVAALNNVVPILRRDRWLAAFVLGLLHGFGFSAALVDLGLAHGELVRVLLGFNVGVEIGQAAAVAVFLPIAFYVRRTFAYRRVGLVGGSLAIALLAAAWVVERALGVTFV